MTAANQRRIRESAAAVLLWLLVPAGVQVGVFVFEALYPDATAAPGGPPPSLLFGVIGLAIGVVAALVLSWRFGLGLIWFGAAIVIAAVVGVLSVTMPQAATTVALLVVPPVGGALFADWFDNRRSS